MKELPWKTYIEIMNENLTCLRPSPAHDLCHNVKLSRLLTARSTPVVLSRYSRGQARVGSSSEPQSLAHTYIEVSLQL